MSAQQAYEHEHSPEIGSISQAGQELAEVIPFRVKAGAGEVAVGAFAGTGERKNPLDSATLAGSGIAMQQGSGTTRYLSHHPKTLSAAPHSHEYNMRAKELLK